MAFQDLLAQANDGGQEADDTTSNKHQRHTKTIAATTLTAHAGSRFDDTTGCELSESAIALGERTNTNGCDDRHIPPEDPPLINQTNQKFGEVNAMKRAPSDSVALDHPSGRASLRRSLAWQPAPVPLGGRALRLKRAMDVAVALGALIALSPILLLLALIIRLDSPGPALYRQMRNGLNGREFVMLKFRTLRVEACAPPDGQCEQIMRNDPRVTRIGHFLRWTSLDELPQLVNVLRGEMSIVGPRPHAISHNEHYAGRIEGYRNRHAVKPGITGWAQVNGHRGETETLDKMEQRLRYDLYYIDHWSLILDVRIIARTLRLGFLDRCA